MNSFKPYKITPVSQALDGSNHALALPQTARSGDVIRVVVSGTATARVYADKTAAAATGSIANGVLMLANSVETFSLDEGVTHIGIDGAAGSTVEVNMGVGL